MFLHCCFECFLIGYFFPRFPLNREEAIQKIVDGLHDRDVIVGTTGMLSRELFEYRETKKQGHEKDFLCVGSMGHASAIALGIATQRPRRQVKKPSQKKFSVLEWV